MPPRRAAAAFAALAALFALGASPARADLGSFGKFTAGLGLLLGAQPDERGCAVGGVSRNLPGTKTCLLFSAGLEGTFLYRGIVGASLSVVGVSGQSSVVESGDSSGSGPPAIPDRVSVPLLLDLRPLGLLVSPGDGGYLARFMHGLRVGIGPSFELVRTSSDSSLDWGKRLGSPARASVGMQVALDGEIPLHAAAASGLSVRFSTRLLYAPLVPLNDGSVRSAPFSIDTSGPPVGSEFVGYGLRYQLFLGLMYYL